MRQGKGIKRRNFLRGSIAVGATALLPGSVNAANAANFSELLDRDLREHAPAALDPAEFHPFMHGVASGDPIPNSVIIWTRVTPDPKAVPGSGEGGSVQVRWEIARDVEFADVVRSGVAATSAHKDHTLHVDPWGLEPSTQYFYRFSIVSGEHAGTISRTGRTKTAPAPGGKLDSVRFAVCSCANFESGYFSSYTDIAHRAARDEIDAVLHLGDYIYEYASGEYAGKFGIVRPHEPTWEITTLADYRTRYGRYRRDAELQAAHQAAPWIVMWDDHEIANNAWEGGAPAHNSWKGEWGARRAAAMQAYLEWLPVRGEAPSQGGHIYRSLRFGDLLELTMLDLRSYRSAPETINIARSVQPDRTIMGSEQFEWLTRKLAAPATKWNLVGTSVMVTPVSLKNLNNPVGEVITRMIGTGSDGLPYNLDQWDGYAADRHRLFAQLAQRRRTNPEVSTVFLAGDIHSEWCSTLEFDGQIVGAEMVCTSISAPNVDDALKLPLGSAVSTQAAEYLKRENPHIPHINLDMHGYSVVEVRGDSISMAWMRVDDVAVAGSPVREALTATFDGASVRVG